MVVFAGEAPISPEGSPPRAPMAPRSRKTAYRGDLLPESLFPPPAEEGDGPVSIEDTPAFACRRIVTSADGSSHALLKPLPSPVRRRHPLIGELAGLYAGGELPSGITAEAVQEENVARMSMVFKHYLPTVEYLFSLPPRCVFDELRLKAVVYTAQLWWQGEQRATLVVPHLGIVLCDLHHIDAVVRTTKDYHHASREWQAALVHKASRLCHEVAHLADHRILGREAEHADVGLKRLLPGWTFEGSPPSPDGTPPRELTLTQVCMLPNYSIYPSLSAVDLRAEWLSEIWLLAGCRQGPVVPGEFLAGDVRGHRDVVHTPHTRLEVEARERALWEATRYWLERTREPCPTLHAFIQYSCRGTQSPAAHLVMQERMSQQAIVAIETYRLGLLREDSAEMAEALKKAVPRAPSEEHVHADDPMHELPSPTTPPAEPAAYAGEAAVGQSWEGRLRPRPPSSRPLPRHGEPMPAVYAGERPLTPPQNTSAKPSSFSPPGSPPTRVLSPRSASLTVVGRTAFGGRTQGSEEEEGDEGELSEPELSRLQESPPQLTGRSRSFSPPRPRHTGTSERQRRRERNRDPQWMRPRAGRGKGDGRPAVSSATWPPKRADRSRARPAWEQTADRFKRRPAHASSPLRFASSPLPAPGAREVLTRSRDKAMEELFLEASRNDRPPIEPAIIFVQFDTSKFPRPQTTRVQCDLAERGALLLYRSVIAVIGKAQASCNWRLVSGIANITFETHEAAGSLVTDGQTLVLTSRLLGGTPPAEGSSGPPQTPSPAHATAEGSSSAASSSSPLEVVTAYPYQPVEPSPGGTTLIDLAKASQASGKDATPRTPAVGAEKTQEPDAQLISLLSSLAPVEERPEEERPSPGAAAAAAIAPTVAEPLQLKALSLDSLTAFFLSKLGVRSSSSRIATHRLMATLRDLGVTTADLTNEITLESLALRITQEREASVRTAFTAEGMADTSTQPQWAKQTARMVDLLVVRGSSFATQLERYVAGARATRGVGAAVAMEQYVLSPSGSQASTPPSSPAPSQTAASPATALPPQQLLTQVRPQPQSPSTREAPTAERAAPPQRQQTHNPTQAHVPYPRSQLHGHVHFEEPPMHMAGSAMGASPGRGTAPSGAEATDGLRGEWLRAPGRPLAEPGRRWSCEAQLPTAAAGLGLGQILPDHPLPAAPHGRAAPPPPYPQIGAETHSAVPQFVSRASAFPSFSTQASGTLATTAGTARSPSPGPQGADDNSDDEEDLWQRNYRQNFVKAPVFSDRRLAKMDGQVVEVLRCLSRLPYRRNVSSRTPFTAAFNPTIERIPNPHATALINTTRAAPVFLTKALAAATKEGRMAAWLERRPILVGLFSDAINANEPGRVWLERFTQQAEQILGPESAYTTLAVELVRTLHHYVVLNSNALIYIGDAMFASAYTPQKALMSAVRGEGCELPDLYRRLELLTLSAYHREAEKPSYIYETLAMTNPQSILELYSAAVQAVRRGPQSYAKSVADALEAACDNAHSYARSVPIHARAALLQLESLSYTSGVIGFDSFCAKQEAAGRKPAQQQQLAFQTPDPLARGTAARPAKKKLVAAALPLTHPPPLSYEQEEDEPQTVAAASFPPQSARKAAIAPPKTSSTAPPTSSIQAAPRPIATDERYEHYYIDWKAVEAAGKGELPPDPSNDAKKRIACMLWPDGRGGFSNAPCTPQQPVVDSQTGQPKTTGGRKWMSYNFKGACKFCSVHAADPRSRVDIPPAFRDGSHTPRQCSRSILALMREGPVGISFLRENRNASRNKK